MGKLDIHRMTLGDLATNCYLVVDPDDKRAVIIDPAAPSTELTRACDTHSIEYILLTHAHADHIGGVASIQQQTGSPVCLHQDDLELYADPVANLSQFTGAEVALPGIDRILADDDEIRLGESVLRVRHTPGHTPGSIILVTTDVAFTGDTLFAGSIGRTDLPGGSHAQMLKSLDTKVKNLAPGTVIYPGHGPETDIEREIRTNPFLQ